ncbi:MAG: amidase [Pseudomonadota bacterium]|nr:amidase [Pseudomonadota bacterium]
MTEPALHQSREPAVTATALVESLRAGEVSAEDTMRRTLDHISRTEPRVHAFVDLKPQQAMEAALAADRVPAEERGPLHGLPIGVKEVFDVAGMRCTWGTSIHEDRIPESDAECVRRMKNAGAIVVGTLVSTEYAIAAAGPTLNPHDPSRTPGGSSSGPGAAVAAGMVPLALGSQTVGSIVRPSVYCGVFGLKPTHGAIPSLGGMPLSPCIDHPGVMAMAPEDIALAARVLYGPMAGDPMSVAVAPPGTPPSTGELRVLVAGGMPGSPAGAASQDAVRQAAQRLGRAGARLEEFTFPPSYSGVVDTLYTLMCRDMALIHGGDYDSAGGQMSEHLRGLIARGRDITGTQFDEARTRALHWRAELEFVLGSDGVLLSPATEGVAPPLAKGTGSNRLQALWSLVGLPVIAVPTGKHEGLPIGVQLGASAGREDLLIAAASTCAG